MKFKIQAFVLGLIFLIQGFGCVSVNAGSVEGWTISYHGSQNSDRTRFYAELTDKYKYNGEKSMQIRYPAADKTEEDYVEIKNPLKSVMQTGRYTLKFYNKGSESPFTEIYAGAQKKITFAEMTKTAAEAPSGEKSWSEYSITFDYTQQEESFLSFRFYSRVTSEVIDDVSLTAEGSDKNLVCDSGFEEFYEDIPEEEYDREDYRPRCLMLSPADGAIILNWRNPASAELDGVKIYDITGGKEKLLSDSESKTPSETVWYKISDLINDEKYQYKIVFSFKTKPDSIYFMGGSPSSGGDYSIGSWNVHAQKSGAAGYCPGEIVLDRGEGHESNTSVRFTANIDRTIDEFKSNIYVNLTRVMNMETGKKYRFSFWIKRRNVQRDMQAHMSWKPFDNQGLSFSDMQGTKDWEYREYDYTFDEKNTLVFLMDGMCEAFWIDDINCYELDENGSVTENNLISDGDFEKIASETVGEITQVEGKSSARSAEITWQLPKKNYAGAYIYQKVFDEYEYRGILASDVSSVSVEGLEIDKEYNFKIVPFNSEGYEGEAAEISITTLIPDFEISDIQLYKDGSAVSGISGAGEYSVSVPVKNYVFEDGFGYEQLVAVYKGDILEKLYSTAPIIEKKGINAPFTKTVTEFSIPEGEGFNVQVFILDSRKDLNVLRPAVFYK